jgi:4-carboxymuconolactone decarboxylase
VAALIARIQTIEMPFHFALALDNGVKPSELSEIITHLAFYSGWANAMSAVSVAKDIFRQHGIEIDQLPPAKDNLLPLNEEAEKLRATQVSANFGATAPGLVENTTDLLFLDLWLRPALAPRDRSLVTVSALIASAQVEQITYHLGRAMDNGLTQVQASEVLKHIAFYAGWPMPSPLCPSSRMSSKSDRSSSGIETRSWKNEFWTKKELKKIVETDDLHVSRFRDWRDVRHSHLDLAGRRRRRPLCARL